MASPPVLTKLIKDKALNQTIPEKAKPGARRMVVWTIELLEFNISFERKGHIKWMLSLDETSNQKGSEAGVILEGLDGIMIEQSSRVRGVVGQEEASQRIRILANTFSWMDPIVGYLWKDEVLTDPQEAKKLKREALKYILRFVDLHKAPPESLHLVTLPWDFHVWGVDILNPFPLVVGQVKFLIAVVDYFTKWVEAKPVATISSKRIRRFYWKRIIYCFSLPTIIFGIKQSFTLVEHLQTNGQAKSANKVVLRGLMRRLEEAKGRWGEELLQVL
ncbi:hypothetical protein CR513_44902, partial [Mucuna pruriens]